MNSPTGGVQQRTVGTTVRWVHESAGAAVCTAAAVVRTRRNAVNTATTNYAHPCSCDASVLASVVHKGPPLRLPAVHEALTAPSPLQANAMQKKKATPELRSEHPIGRRRVKVEGAHKIGDSLGLQ